MNVRSIRPSQITAPCRACTRAQPLRAPSPLGRSVLKHQRLGGGSATMAALAQAGSGGGGGGSGALNVQRSTSFATSTLEDFRIVGENVTTAGLPEALRRDCVLFYAPDCKELADKIAEESGGAVTLGNIRWK